jgi:hypothetical protein
MKCNATGAPEEEADDSSHAQCFDEKADPAPAPRARPHRQRRDQFPITSPPSTLIACPVM